jgi:hypothetical protein
LLLVGLRTDWLRRKDAMKTAGRKTKATNVVASRVCGTEGENNLAPWGGLDGKKNFGHRKSVFSLTPFMELIVQVKFIGENAKCATARWGNASAAEVMSEQK